MSVNVKRYMVDYYRAIMSEFFAAFNALIPYQITSIKVSAVHGKLGHRQGDNIRVTKVSDTSKIPNFSGTTEDHRKLLAELAEGLLSHEGLVNGAQLDTHIKSLRQSNNIHQDEIVIVLLSSNPKRQGR